MVPKVDTFAKDISDEIKHKEASLADIATASNDIGNAPEGKSAFENKSSRIFIIAIIFLVLCIVGLGGFIYYYFTSSEATQEMITTDVPVSAPKKAASLSSVSVTLNENIGIHIKGVEKKDQGYVLTLSSYAPVFAYMTRNEAEYIDELLNAVNGTTTTPVAKKKDQSVPQAATASTTPSAVSTSTSTSTSATTSTTRASQSITASSTSPSNATSTISKETDEMWTNITLSNVNMRVYKRDGKSIVYAFVSSEKVVIARTAEDVLTIKGAILR